ncbi:MAG: polysaccharide deacetylase family protein [Burkholderiaceae bacterium]|mgnify:FL=1|jgi:peptidoglycan/xylan/chitin deacetylase (PgdA/CDA1 family)|uniref:Polysaccharide deacetylase family protein n=1 Tax=Cupriavidus metallidurans TaxID=119219 RepID=A0A482IYC3_9BURK|nr:MULTISPECIES: polysaccharide deacetylase family protein [Cupriavidus]KWR81928.1 peptidase A8 [Cupriavidus sp. SHE]PCH55655.1 MAG: polysaccharide deacetylase family protein [Burkholderiaceae bacterium]QBP11690.1 polysaccharide deacetylase family protein [Cupriavidus metallidurans]QWC90262.1 polysaccharide deacetylase family protein [Cupriavidus metallidurans]
MRNWMIRIGVAAAGLLTSASLALAADASPGACRAGTLYLTFDTGSMSQAELIARTLRKHHIRATFFLANEPTVNHDNSLDPTWAAYWKSLAADGHAFGTHTFDHVYLRSAKGGEGGKVVMRPQFGAQGGKDVAMTEESFCSELRRSAQAFQSMTGQPMVPLWRAPGGHTSPKTLAWAEQCGFKHVGWAPAGFLGDELSSERYSNQVLLERALRDLRDGDITMAHLGIWSRKDPWAPGVLEPLISGLEQKGFCFATLREHPQYKHWIAQRGPVRVEQAGEQPQTSSVSGAKR